MSDVSQKVIQVYIVSIPLRCEVLHNNRVKSPVHKSTLWQTTPSSGVFLVLLSKWRFIVGKLGLYKVLYRPVSFARRGLWLARKEETLQGFNEWTRERIVLDGLHGLPVNPRWGEGFQGGSVLRTGGLRQRNRKGERWDFAWEESLWDLGTTFLSPTSY